MAQDPDWLAHSFKVGGEVCPLLTPGFGPEVSGLRVRRAAKTA
jgi:hypothetical protein